MFMRCCRDPRLGGLALGTGLGETGAEDHGARHTLAGTRLERLGHETRRNGHDRQVDIALHRGDVGIGSNPLNVAVSWVHRIDRTLEARQAHPVDRAATNPPGIVRGSDHRDGAWIEQGVETGAAFKAFGVHVAIVLPAKRCARGEVSYRVRAETV